MQDTNLGQWAVIDIETTGIDPNYDEIIDVGYLQFEGTKLVKRFESLVGTDQQLSQFIQKLTGIQNAQVKKAPAWSQVEGEVQELASHHLLAHNSDFEESFLSASFDKLRADLPIAHESYQDSLFLLAILAPWMSSLKLENFIVDWKIAESEAHRALRDSEDLLKVILVGCWHLHQDVLRREAVLALIKDYKLDGEWIFKWPSLSIEQLEEVALAFSNWDFHASCEQAAQAFRFDRRDFQAEQEKYQHSFDLEFSGENIQKIYQNSAAMKERFEGYQYRQAQEKLSLRVGQALKNNVHALVQAPTGTGKTLGYLLPSALYALENEQQVLVATGTKTLQNQAYQKDVPALYKILGLDSKELPMTQLVGSKNHLCEMLFRKDEDQQAAEEALFGEVDEDVFSKRFSGLYFDLVFFHNAHNPQAPILGDDLPYIFKQKIPSFKSLAKESQVDFRSCTGYQCPFKEECTYIQGLRRAKESKIIIGNHALMFQWPRSFDRPSAIIIDEAHKIESEATKTFTYQVSHDDFKSTIKALMQSQGLGSLFYLLAEYESNKGEATDEIKNLRQRGESASQMLTEHFSPLTDLVENFFKRRPRYTDLYWNEAPMPHAKKTNQDALSQSILNHLESIKNIIFDLLDPLVSYLARWEVKSLRNEKEVLAYGRFETFVDSLQDIYRALEMALEAPESHACSLSFHEKQGLLIQSAPINVGEVLHSGLLENTDSVIFTSATLANATGDRGVRGIEWATGYIYLDPSRRFREGLFLPAVYDYKNKTKVFLCDDTPSLHAPDFVPSCLETVARTIENIGGKSLLLFSAKTRFEVAREILLEKFQGQIPLFIQGMGSQVVEDFKKAGNGILLGMESFGEGIDVPGEALQFVFIDKIPDLRMDYVVNQRRDFYEANLGNEFVDYYLAHRTRSLHQKLGRLLRTENDRGGVIIVDSRIKRWKGATMEKFNSLMAPYQIRRNSLKEACQQIEEFLN